ncbi:GNAT family N-acetyltransferase [Kitasatospora sp. NPDC004669]|uniref:GNAT family N-acetyltransferase n=1 Tax=Kitasatospora sp. NPDC004669 TaxID=3154555 RepID=UPI0033B74C39
MAEILADAAGGVFPPPDGSVTVVPQPSPRKAGVVSFAAHAVVFTDEDPAWVHETLAADPGDPLAAPLCPPFLTAFAGRTGRTVNNIDLLSVADRLPGEPPLPLSRVEDREHPRVVRALRYREDVRIFTADGGVLVLGRALATAARHLLPEGGVVWAQQAPGNAPSVRAFHAAGYRPVGAEALLVVGQP